MKSPHDFMRAFLLKNGGSSYGVIRIYHQVDLK